MAEYEVQGFPTIYLLNPKTKVKTQIGNEKLFTPDAKENLIEEFMTFARQNPIKTEEETK